MARAWAVASEELPRGGLRAGIALARSAGVALDDANLISSAWLHRASSAAEAAGAPAARIRLALGIEALEDESAVSRDLYLELWEQLVDATERTLPLRAGREVRMRPGDVLAAVCATVPTLGEAVHTLVKYLGAWTQAVRVEVHVDDARTTWVEMMRVRPTSRRGAAYADEFLVTDLLVGAGWVTGERLRPVGVRFTHARSAPLSAYRTALGVVPTFDAKRTAFGLSEEQCRLPLVRHDPWMRSFVREAAERAVNERARRAPPGSFEDRVRGELMQSFGRCVPAVATVARRLGTSERTLRRRLEDDGVSFTEVLDAARHEEAVRLLSLQGETIAEIAAHLGFSHLSSFHRACVRWTGLSPSVFRAGRGALEPPRVRSAS